MLLRNYYHRNSKFPHALFSIYQFAFTKCRKVHWKFEKTKPHLSWRLSEIQLAIEWNNYSPSSSKKKVNKKTELFLMTKLLDENQNQENRRVFMKNLSVLKNIMKAKLEYWKKKDEIWRKTQSSTFLVWSFIQINE